MSQDSSSESAQMSGFTRTRLTNHQPLITPVSQGKAVLIMGVIFICLGLFLLLAGLKVVEVSDITPSKELLVSLVGGMFALGGVALLIHGIRGWRKKARAAQWLQLHPDEPWMAEHAWDPVEAHDFAGRKIVKNMVNLIFMGIFLIPFHIVGFQYSWGFLAISFVFDLIILAWLVYQIYLIRRRSKYGESVLKYTQFPIFLGQPFEVTLVNSKGIEWIRKIDFTLRYVEMVYETTGTGQNRSTQLVFYELYKDSYSFSEEELDTQSHEIPISFLLPQGDYANKLLTLPMRYWSLHIHADTPGVDYGAAFLLPIYAKPN